MVGRYTQYVSFSQGATFGGPGASASQMSSTGTVSAAAAGAGAEAGGKAASASDPGPSFQPFIDAANQAYAKNPATVASAMAPPLAWLRGIRIHADFAASVDAVGGQYSAEVSYKGGVPVPYGTPGSVRADGIYGPIGNPLYAVELKSGMAALTSGEIAAYRANLPPGTALYTILEAPGKP